MNRIYKNTYPDIKKSSAPTKIGIINVGGKPLGYM